jgi:hypothetical protein
VSEQQPPEPTPPTYGAPPPQPPPGQQWQPAPQWQQQGYGYGVAPESKTLGTAIAALVCGIVGLLVFNIILGPLAFVFGLQARRKIRESNGYLKGDGMALTGIIMGPIDVILWVIILSVTF